MKKAPLNFAYITPKMNGKIACVENDNESDISDSKPHAVKTVKRSKNEWLAQQVQHMSYNTLELEYNRSIMTIETDGRYSSVFSIFKDQINRSELDSHADTCVGGANTILLEPSGTTATVHSFSEEHKPFDQIPIGTIATSWTNPEDGITYVLCFPESLYFGDQLPRTLICPNQ